MFNGNLLHAVTPNLSNKTRVTFIANFGVEYTKERVIISDNMGIYKR